MYKLLKKLVPLCAMALVGAANLNAATITTDKEDYPPESTAIITGAGFAAGETVELQVLRIDKNENSGPEHLPWQITADENGEIATSWDVTIDEAGATLELTATGLSSGEVAKHVFTDSSVTAATGGNTISAGNVGGAWTSLTGPTVTETAVGDLPSSGTIVLRIPPGFEFDTAAPAPNIKLTTGDTGNANKNINNTAVNGTMAVTTTATNITFTFTSKSSGNTLCTLLYQNIRVRPTQGAPLASGNITNSGTAVPGIGSLIGNYGTLTGIPGPLAQFAVSNPGTVTAGTAFTTATITAQDIYGNTATNFTGTVIFTETGAGAGGTVTPSTSAAFTAGVLANPSLILSQAAASGVTLTVSNNVASGKVGTSSGFTVNKATPTISGVTTSQSINYGAASISLSGTVSASGPLYPANGESVLIIINGVTNSATFSGGTGGFSGTFNTATIPYSASAYTITYSYTGNANLNAASNNATALTVNKAALSITANNDSKTYGQTKTYGAGQATFSSSGLQNSETIGSVTITASGGTASTAAVGTYNLTPSAATGGTFNAANYNLTYNNGTLTVNKASTTSTVATTAARALPGVNVSFTNTLSVVAPGAGTPTGTVQFKTNGVAFGSPVSLSGLIATSAATATLPHGSNVVTAEYAGDSNFIGVTNSLTPAQIINTPPVARSVTTSVPQNGVIAINFDLGKYKLATDADADALKIIFVSGATNATLGIISNGLTMTYTNTGGTAGTFDAFSFVVSDGLGGLATNTATVRIESPMGFNQLTANGNTLKYLGVPGAVYALENTPDFAPANWHAVKTNTVGADGSVTFTPGGPPSGFYRTRFISGP